MELEENSKTSLFFNLPSLDLTKGDGESIIGLVIGLKESMRENNWRSGAKFVLSIFIIAGILGALINAISLLNVFPLPEKLPIFDFFSGPIGFFPARKLLQVSLIGDLALSTISFLLLSFISKPQQLIHKNAAKDSS